MASADQREHRFDGTWEGWRTAARMALAASLAPERVWWRESDDAQDSLFGAAAEAPTGASTGALAEDAAPAAGERTVPRGFVGLGADVACHREPSRWDTLYRVLWRLTHGERHLLDVSVDDDVYRLLVMAKAVRREGHKLRAFVRFRRVGADTPRERYVAWFEPEHDVLAREAPFFARRFPSMRWSILTPSLSVHWEGSALAFAPGVSRLDAPSGDDLEQLWLTYYAHTFNPARTKPRMMRSEMPVRYWKHLPEAVLIAPLLRDAPARVREMLERQLAAAERPPDRLPPRSRQDEPAGTGQRPDPSREVPGPANRYDAGVAVAHARSERARALLAARGTSPVGSAIDGRDVRVGTASWTDPSMLAPGVFYPDGVRSAADRLAYYASRFAMVEVDSTYYALPSQRNAELWAARTPDGFTFHIKAHAWMTGHATSVARLPADLREALPARLASRATVRGVDVPAELIDELWRRFTSAIAPLAEAGRLGALLLQLPRDCVASPEGERTIAALRARAGDTLCCAVELRHASWVADDARRTRTLDLLRADDLVHVMVDAPPGFATSMPPVVAVTNERLAIVRMHGRRTETWERPVATTSERYRHLYDAAQLGEWVPRIIDVAQRTQGVHVVMNNCHANYGTSNADEITALLVEADLERRRMGRAGRHVVDEVD